MNRWIALAAVGLMLVVPVASGAEWLRSGYDPGRTGAIPYEGPATNDTAFQVQLNGTPVDTPVIQGDTAYILTIEGSFYDGPTDHLDTRAIWSIDLATGSVDKVLDAQELNVRMLTAELLIHESRDDDGDGQALVATAYPSGTERWRTTVFDETVFTDQDYEPQVVVDGTLYARFDVAREDAPEPEALEGLVAIDIPTGEVDWTWNRTTSMRDARGLPGPLATQGSMVGDPTNVNRDLSGMTVAVDDEQVYAYTAVTTEAWQDLFQYEVWALDRTNGDVVWSHNDTTREARQGDALSQRLFCCAHPVVTETAVHTRLDAFVSLNKGTGEMIWQSTAGSRDRVESQGAKGMASRGDVLIGTTEQTVFRIDPASGDLLWQATDPTPGRANMVFPVTLDAQNAYITQFRNGTGLEQPRITAYDQETGQRVWTWTYPTKVGVASSSSTFIASQPAFGPGIAIWGAQDGKVTILGRTDASLGTPDVEAEHYPEPGEPYQLDLSSTEPGAFGPATRYRVAWGDGTVSGWQDSPVFEHTYNETGDETVRLQVANDANQTASTFATMHVGGEEPNIVSTAFAPRNQDLTFGVLGLLVAFTGGAIGVTRRYRKRSLLEDEIEAMEAGFEQLEDRPSECEAFLDNRKARARSLAIDGKLEEQQVTVLESRAEELRGSLRLEALQEEFAFLPHGLVIKARQMVTDGDVSALEREAFLAALEEDEMLTEAQQATVRERIERWYARDGGGGAGA